MLCWLSPAREAVRRAVMRYVVLDTRDGRAGTEVAGHRGKPLAEFGTE